MSGSRSMHASGPSSSRFLNMLNPMSRNIHGYSQANQSVPEEDEDDDRTKDEHLEEDDLEAGRSFRSARRSTSRTPFKQGGRRQVSWDEAASDVNVLRPNIHKEDRLHHESSDDEVPQSFMIEATSRKSSASKGKQRADGSSSTKRSHNSQLTSEGIKLVLSTPPSSSPGSGPEPSVSTPPRPSELDIEEPDAPDTPRIGLTNALPQHNRQPKPLRGLDDYEKALWNWVNVYNLDAFLQDVYHYYEGKGIYSIALSRGLNLLTVGFVIGFSTFLLGCIDYSQIRHGKPTQLSHVVIDHCVAKFSGFTLLFFLLFTAFYIWQIVAFVLGTMRLVDMYNFYTHLLKIPDSDNAQADIQTISWPEVVRRIGAIREENPITALSSKNSRRTNDTTTAKLDAHDVANRILRQDNYLIALFNKELLDLRVPLPAMLKQFVSEEQGKGKMLTQALEWNLRFCLMEYLFDDHGRVRKVFLKSKHRRALIEGLKRRFIFMGILNAIFAPFIVLYLVMRRLDESYPVANIYIGQFPNEKVTLIMRFVAFIAGSFAAVLLLATVIAPDIFFEFEITPHRTAVFYLGVFTAGLAVARGMIPEDNKVFDPELLMMEVITYTHYMPDEWKDQLHSKQVHQGFGSLFAMKILIFSQELLSVVLTPFVLWFSLPACAPAIIDFFREFSVHVDGRGYVCSFAEFNFERHGNVKFGAPTRVQDKKMVSNDGKMEKSFLNFKAANPDWIPADPSGSLYLNRMADYGATHAMHPFGRRRHPGAGGLEGAVHFQHNPKPQVGFPEKTQEYDHALRQSQYAAVARRRGAGGSASVMAASMLGTSGLTPPAVGASSASSMFHDGLDTAQTAVLGDSQGSVQFKAQASRAAQSTMLAEEIELDTGLGESYADGAKRARPFGEVEEEDDVEDGGVLRLLAQIYGRNEGKAGVL
ncbi:hypothetical protein H0H93_011738 [Arthromyces matolae]|nr:hypothetical protein H0H93_011738 [Arthromyces matolae]